MFVIRVRPSPYDDDFHSFYFGWTTPHGESRFASVTNKPREAILYRREEQANLKCDELNRDCKNQTFDVTPWPSGGINNATNDH